MTDITETDAWRRGEAAAKALVVVQPADVGKEREDKWRRIIAEACVRRDKQGRKP